MRKPQYLSPTSLGLFYDNPQEFYLQYLAGERPPRFPQTQPMACGSSLDAYAKSFLHERLFGKGHDPKFEFTTLFEAQVESQHRDFARGAGEYLFDVYKRSGALADLMLDLQKAVGTPRFELEVRGVIDGQREGVTLDVGGIPFLGKPDCFYINAMGAHVILDWKVNGYCSKYAVSPMKGYVRLRENGKQVGQHRECQPMSHKGVMINLALCLSDANKDWARQLAIYGWLCGEEVGADFIVAIDQFVCKPLDGAPRPHVRIAEHRLRIRGEAQWSIFASAQRAWEIIHSDHFFREMSAEDSRAKCEVLNEMAASLRGEGTEADKWFADATRGS
jgi:hypothetical protein